MRIWPPRLLDINLEFDRENIEPYTLTIKTCDDTHVYVGDDIERNRSWKKTIENDKDSKKNHHLGWIKLMKFGLLLVI